jgi:hypothetical protein
MMPGIRALLGLLVLFLGRKLYWLMVGVGGLLAGMEFATTLLANSSPVVRVIVAIAAGLIGVLVAIIAQRVAFALLGFFGVGFIALTLTPAASSDAVHLTWFVLAGLAGAIIAALLMDWAIIVLTALAGAAAIVTSFAMTPLIQTIVFVILAVVGIAIQSWSYERPTGGTDVQQE